MPAVEATLHYLAPMEERPYYYTYPPPDGAPWRNTHGDRQKVRVGDARELSAASLDVEGFALAPFSPKDFDAFDPESVKRVHYPEVEALVRGATGAARVLAFDHNVRHGESADRNDLSQAPVHFVHNDYTVGSGPQRVRDLVGGEEAEALVRRRFAVVNVWRPLRGPVRSEPLAFCDASSMRPGDFVATDLRYPDRTGEIYSVLFSPAHRWLHYPSMRADEALLLKCYDSDASRAGFTAHTAIEDPGAPDDAPPRESIEVRTLAFFA